jgi:hypothetical protein
MDHVVAKDRLAGDPKGKLMFEKSKWTIWDDPNVIGRDHLVHLLSRGIENALGDTSL